MRNTVLVAYPSRLLFALSFALAAASAPLDARADDGVDHAFDVQRSRQTLGVGEAMQGPSLIGFDAGDPRTGLMLIGAYAPTPLLLVETLADDFHSRPFSIAQLVAASLGSIAATVGYFDAISGGQGANMSIATLATAHAMSWNLELATRALVRLIVGDLSGPAMAALPSFLPLPLHGGAGLVVRWMS